MEWQKYLATLALCLAPCLTCAAETDEFQFTLLKKASKRLESTFLGISLKTPKTKPKNKVDSRVTSVEGDVRKLKKVLGNIT